MDNKLKVRISENNYNLLQEANVNALLANYNKKIKESGIGYNGALTPSNLFKIVDLVSEFDYIDELEDDPILQKIHSNYVKAMDRNKPDSSLTIGRFAYYLIQPDVYLYQYSNSYIIGQYVNGFFKVSHFAPQNIFDGIKAIKEIITYDNIIFAVTEKLQVMLKRLGAFTHHKLNFPMIFRDMLVDKHIVVTNPQVISKFLYAKTPEELLALQYSDLED
jgi:hypothetical protein